MLMGFIQTDVTRHPQVHLDGYMTAYTACTQMVHLARHGFACHYRLNLAFHLSRQTLFEQFASRLLGELPCRAYDEHAHYNSRYGVEHCPFLTKQYGSANAHCRTNRREGIAAVVPCVGNDSLRLALATHLGGKP